MNFIFFLKGKKLTESLSYNFEQMGEKILNLSYKYLKHTYFIHISTSVLSLIKPLSDDNPQILELKHKP